MPRVSETLRNLEGLDLLPRDSNMRVRCRVRGLHEWLTQAIRVDVDDQHTTYSCSQGCGLMLGWFLCRRDCSTGSAAYVRGTAIPGRRSVRSDREVCQPTTNRLYASITNEA